MLSIGDVCKIHCDRFKVTLWARATFESYTSDAMKFVGHLDNEDVVLVVSPETEDVFAISSSDTQVQILTVLGVGWVKSYFLTRL